MTGGGKKGRKEKQGNKSAAKESYLHFLGGGGEGKEKMAPITSADCSAPGTGGLWRADGS